MAGEDCTGNPVSNSQRTVPGLIGVGFGLDFSGASLVSGGSFAACSTFFFPQPPTHKHKAMKMGFIATDHTHAKSGVNGGGGIKGIAGHKVI
tara:strand:- start:566 stop:841 length:276 start_codon:yes stop_codon:yes gene_type:complete